MKISFDSQSILIDGRREFLVSGEFHYFRVPPEDWRRRMELFKEAGGNCLATYVPWIIHEPEEGRIVFGDQPKRDFARFLETARDAGLAVIARPGPYQYSELAYHGLPEWLVKNYPTLLAKKADETNLAEGSVSYMHPLFLEKARRYYRAFAEVVRPYLASNGGPVVLLQLDNELTGVHVWFYGPDCNPETFGFGTDDGRYPSFLREKYGDIAVLNKAYGTSWTSFADARPLTDAKPVEKARSDRDYRLCYLRQIGEYMRTLKGWLREDGISEPVCHNAANPAMNTFFREAAESLGPDFLLGSDHYYTLNQMWGQENPTPSYFFHAQLSCDTMRTMGGPPVVFEMPGGSPSDMPPILRNDLLACYMTNLSLGMKGVNYYVYTGGPNFPDTGTTCDLYDYNALVHADGSLNETYYAAVDFGHFLKSRPDLLTARRVASVQLGIEFDAYRGACSASPEPELPNAAKAWEFAERGLLYSLTCSKYSSEYVDLEKPLDKSRPLLIASMAMMSQKAQRNVADFVLGGGQLLLAPCVPKYDLDLAPCTILADALGLPEVKAGGKFGRVFEYDGLRLYQMTGLGSIDNAGDGEKLVTDTTTGRVVGCRAKAGKGEVVLLSFSWNAVLFTQSQMLEGMLASMGAKPAVESSNRNVFTTLFEGDDGRQTVFALNLHASPQSTRLIIHRDGKAVKTLDLHLDAMQVQVVDVG